MTLLGSRFAAEVEASRARRASAQALLATLRNHPGHADQKSHGRKGGGGGGDFDRKVADAATGEDALRMTDVRPTDRGQRSAIDSYASGAYDQANRTLRTDKGDVESMPQNFDRELIERFDSIVQPTTGDIVVSRGLASGKRTFGGRTPTVGMEWTDHGFSSTTTNDHPDYTFTGDSGVEMRIRVPKGTRAFSNSHLDPGEVVLDRGLSFRIVGDNGIHPVRGTRQLDVEVIGSRHDG